MALVALAAMVLLALVPMVYRLRSPAGRRPSGPLLVSVPPVVEDAVVPGAWSLAARVPLALVPDSPMLPWSCFDSCLPWQPMPCDVRSVPGQGTNCRWPRGGGSDAA